MSTARIIIGIDASPEARRTLAYVISAAVRDNTEIIAVHVFEALARARSHPVPMVLRHR